MAGPGGDQGENLRDLPIWGTDDQQQMEGRKQVKADGRMNFTVGRRVDEGLPWWGSVISPASN
jgi:hypothetical protein